MGGASHGVDGWYLADYEWDEKTGLATFTYEREDKVLKKVEVETTARYQTTWLV